MVSKTQMIGQSNAAAEISVGDQEAKAPEPVPDANFLAQPTPDARPALDPTRYGDWEKNGRCIDF